MKEPGHREYQQVPSEGQKFDAVMRKILTVSKDELKKREKAWRRKREQAKKNCTLPICHPERSEGSVFRRRLNIRLTERRYSQ